MSDKPKLVSITSKKPEAKEVGFKANEALDKAKDIFSEDMVILGWGKADGSLTFITPSRHKSEIVYLLELTKHTIMTGDYHDADD